MYFQDTYKLPVGPLYIFKTAMSNVHSCLLPHNTFFSSVYRVSGILIIKCIRGYWVEY